MNVLIIEDELKTAILLKELIESNPNYYVDTIIDSVEKSVSYLKKEQDNIDLLFLDIQLADGQSFKIFEQIQIDIPVVFCTAYDEYVLQAFKNNGIDYILKPFEDKDIHNALEKIAKFKIPRYIEYRQEFSRTPSGKIEKHVLITGKEDLTAGCYDRFRDHKPNQESTANKR